MASQLNHIRLAQSLPPRLLKFFARYPPPISSTLQNTQPLVTVPLNASSLNTMANQTEATISSSAPASREDPFRSTKHPITGNWHDPVYSLRRQADLVKLAREHGIEELLPFTIKGTEVRIKRREENGLRVKGTGIGQKVKGKLWERTMKGRLEKRKQAMLDMPKMIQYWKQVNHPMLFTPRLLTFL